MAACLDHARQGEAESLSDASGSLKLINGQ
jgi:hypothetical protein